MDDRDRGNDMSNRNFGCEPSASSHPLFPSAYPSQASSSLDVFEYFKGYFEKPRDRRGGQEAASGQKGSHPRYEAKADHRDRSRSPLQSYSSYKRCDRSHPKESASRSRSKSSRSPVKEESRSRHPKESSRRSRSKSSRSPVKEESTSRQRSDRKTDSRSPEKKSVEVKSFTDSKNKPEQKGEKKRENSTDFSITSEGKKERRKKDLSLFAFSEGETPIFDPYYIKPRSSASASSEPKVPKEDTTPDRSQRAYLPEAASSSSQDVKASSSHEREIQQNELPVKYEPKRERSRSFSLAELEDLDLPEIPTVASVKSAQLSDVSSESSEADFEQDQSRGLNLNRESRHENYVHQAEFDNPPRQPRVSEQQSRREIHQEVGWRGSNERDKDPLNKRPTFRETPHHGHPSPAKSREPSKHRANVGCIQCFSNAHILENCKHFHKMSMDERWALIKNFPGKICQACLEKDHVFKTCSRKNQCSVTSPICGNPLHPLLHGCPEPNCFLCQNGDHSVQDCEMFVEMSMPDRWDVIRARKLCSVCLKINHKYERCAHLAVCPKSKICTIKHHPLLHTCETAGHRQDEGRHADRSWKDPNVEGGNYEPRRSRPIGDRSHPRADQYQNDHPQERRSRENTSHRNEHTDDYKYESRYDDGPNFEEKGVRGNDTRSFKGRSVNSRNTYSHDGYDSSSQDGFNRQLYNQNSRYYNREGDFDNPDFHGRGQPRGNKNDYYPGGERQQASAHPKASSYGHHQRDLSEGKEDDTWHKPSHYEYKNQPRSSSKLNDEDLYCTKCRSRSHSKESCPVEVFCNYCKRMGHKPSSCPTLSASKDDSKTQKKGLDNLYAHFYYAMKKSGKDTSLAWEMVESWRVARHSEQSLRDLVESHKPKTRQLLESLLKSELENVPEDVKLEVDLHLVIDETIRFLEHGAASR